MKEVSSWSLFKSGVACFLRHPNIVQHIEFVVDEGVGGPAHPRLVPVMEALHGPDLFDWMRARQAAAGSGSARWISQGEVACVARQVLSALKYLHGHTPQVIHRDVKPENLRWATRSPDSDLKLVDFGLAHVAGFDEQASTWVGTSLYSAPVVLRPATGNLIAWAAQPPTPALDMFSLGVVLFLLLAGRYPHAEAAETETPSTFSAPWHLLPEGVCSDLVRQLLEPDSGKRWTARQAIESRWFTEAQGPAGDAELPEPSEKVDTLRFFSALSARSKSAL